MRRALEQDHYATDRQLDLASLGTWLTLASFGIYVSVMASAPRILFDVLLEQVAGPDPSYVTRFLIGLSSLSLWLAFYLVLLWPLKKSARKYGYAPGKAGVFGSKSGKDWFIYLVLIGIGTFLCGGWAALAMQVFGTENYISYIITLLLSVTLLFDHIIFALKNRSSRESRSQTP